MATHNGSTTLPLTLDAFFLLKSPAQGFEIIIVDNASTDTTPALLRAYADRLPLTILSEPKPGKSCAINRGLGAVKGDLVLLTDDDVLPTPEWLLAYENAARLKPHIAIFAGQVRHHWQKKPPAWLVRLADAGEAFAGTPVSRPAGPIEGRRVKGPNFMVRAAVFDSLRFREDIGWGANGRMVAGEESEFCQRALAAGYGSWYVPEACVQHIVRPHQIGLRAVLQRYFRIGLGMEASGTPHFAGDVKTLFGYPRYLAPLLLRYLACSAYRLARGDSSGSVMALMQAAMQAGMAQQWRNMRGAITTETAAGATGRPH